MAQSDMILAAEWVVPVTSPPLRDHAVEIKNGLIQQIRPIRKSDPHLKNTCLLPGLVNAHTHLAYTALRNLLDRYEFFPWLRKLTEIKYGFMTEKDIATSTKLGIHECLKAGITTVADLCDWETALQTLSRSPMRGIFYWEIFGVERSQADQTWRDLQTTFPRLVRKYATERLQIGISPHACFTVRPELYSRVARWAVQNKIPVSFHASESRAEEDFIGRKKGPIAEFVMSRAPDWRILGPTSVRHLEKTGIFNAKPLLAHLVHADRRDLGILSRYPVSIAHCPKSNAKFAHGTAPLAQFVQSGRPVGLGSDSAASNNRFDLFEEARFALLQQRSREQKQVCDEQQALEWITIGGARAMGLGHRIGSLQPGKEADLIAIRLPYSCGSGSQVLNHVIHNTSASDVRGTWIAGRRAVMPRPTAAVRKMLRSLSHFHDD